MRILHTSDWHLGQSLHDFDRTYEHQRFLDWLLDQLEQRRVDALLVAGDIFDNANPSAASQRQLYHFLQAAKARVPHLNVVIIAGNHDSPSRLEAPAPLLENLDTVVIGPIHRTGAGEVDVERLVVPLKTFEGEVGAWCLAVPFLRPGDVARLETEGDPYFAGVAELYRQAFELAQQRRRAGQGIVALGHCHMDGGNLSEGSERRIVIGGAEMLPPGLFDEGVAYAGLGHLHLPQKVGGTERIRYAGSPLPMSFAEVHYPHQILLVELDGESVKEIETVRVPHFVRLLRVPDSPAPLAEVMEALGRLETSEAPMEEWPYLEVKVLLEGPEPGLRAKVEEALRGKAVRLARIDPTYQRSSAAENSNEAGPQENLDQLQPEAVFGNLYRQKYQSSVPEPLLRAFGELLLEATEEVQP